MRRTRRCRPTEDDLAHYDHIADKKRRTYAAMMHALDRGVGRLLDWLEEKRKKQRTRFIVFFSDNGGATSNASWNGPLSGAKGSLLEGGVRIPMIWSWPGIIPAGKEHEAPVSSLDLLPTFMAAGGAEPLPLANPRPYEDKKNRQRAVKQYGAYDGNNLLPFLGRGKSSARAHLLLAIAGTESRPSTATTSSSRFRTALPNSFAQLRIPANRTTALLPIPKR